MDNDEETRKDVFAWAGSAIYAAQLFETELVTLLICNERLQNAEFAFKNFDGLDTLFSKKTLGQLIVEIKKRVLIPSDVEQLFIEYRDKRNYLAHSFFVENGKKLLNLTGCQEMIEELQGIYACLREADSIATKISESIRVASGIDEVELQKLAKEQLEKLKA